MIEAAAFAFGFIALLGTVATALSKNPFDKLISLALIPAGIIPFIVDRGYLDVATAVALIAPVTTIFVLLVAWREG